MEVKLVLKRQTRHIFSNVKTLESVKKKIITLVLLVGFQKFQLRDEPLDSSSERCFTSERRFYDDHDRKVNGSTTNLVSLLRPWIKCFTMIISAWWNLASSKLKKSEAKFNRKTWKQRQLLSKSGFVLRIAPPSLSRDRRIKMKKSINF